MKWPCSKCKKFESDYIYEGKGYCGRCRPANNVERWLIKNLIYCEDTHSFVHRFYDALNKKMPKGHKEAQDVAFKVLGTMFDDFEKQRE